MLFKIGSTRTLALRYLRKNLAFLGLALTYAKLELAKREQGNRKREERMWEGGQRLGLGFSSAALWGKWEQKELSKFFVGKRGHFLSGRKGMSVCFAQGHWAPTFCLLWVWPKLNNPIEEWSQEMAWEMLTEAAHEDAWCSWRDFCPGGCTVLSPSRSHSSGPKWNPPWTCWELVRINHQQSCHPSLACYPKVSTICERLWAKKKTTVIIFLWHFTVYK